ncbi:CMRF35-like molecule 5 isoform X3 [Cyprinus carpio]|uniref:CMRF35-like molecule 5 isoform X3 n=1 Tax=Cyprinus carpio TaxID=7962 RepID=A0A9Q9YJ41_CYPCA|nr:CMRF35-like molecule 5 isoform X3 [Cyprinus carpio]
MKIIWTFTLLMIPDVVRSISVKGYSDGEVNITCRYVEKDTQNTKYFCKGKKPEKEKGKWCIELIRTEEKDKWVHSGRFSLYDDTRAAVFTVTFRDLSEQDSGMYQCAVDRTMKKDSYTEVKMNVRKERDKHQTTSSSLSSVKPPLITSPSPVTGSSLIISVSVLLLLIVPVILLVMVTLWRRH